MSDPKTGKAGEACACGACDEDATTTDSMGIPSCEDCKDWDRIDGQTCVCNAPHHGRYVWDG